MLENFCMDIRSLDFNITKSKTERRGNPQCLRDNLIFCMDFISVAKPAYLKVEILLGLIDKKTLQLLGCIYFFYYRSGKISSSLLLKRTLSSSASDHISIALSCIIKFHCPKIFRFEAWWVKELDLEDVVYNQWKRISDEPNPAATWVSNLRNLRKILKL